MPRPVEWLQQLPAALDTLRDLKTPVVDRTMMAWLLGLQPHTAMRLMHRLGGYKSSSTFLSNVRLSSSRSKE